MPPYGVIKGITPETDGELVGIAYGDQPVYPELVVYIIAPENDGELVGINEYDDHATELVVL